MDDNVERRDDTTTYQVPNSLLMNTGSGRFVEVSRQSGSGMNVSLSSRGLAVGDLDDDGDVDLVVLNSRREPTVLRNESRLENHWLGLRLIGRDSNRSAIGAQVKVMAGEKVQVREVCSGRGYQSHSDLRLLVGLGDRTRVDRLEVRWPGGRVETRDKVSADQLLTIVEGEH
jgi:hypothetical protein